MNCQCFFRTIGIIGLAALWATPKKAAAEVRRLTLEEAVHLAVSQNCALKIARLKVDENQQKKAGDRSAYFPSITNQSNALHITELQKIDIQAGAFGSAGGALIPGHDINIGQGKLNLVSSGTMIAQPLTQLIRIVNRTGSQPPRWQFPAMM